jgi:hypothetical protein
VKPSRQPDAMKHGWRDRRPKAWDVARMWGSGTGRACLVSDGPSITCYVTRDGYSVRQLRTESLKEERGVGCLDHERGHGLAPCLVRDVGHANFDHTVEGCGHLFDFDRIDAQRAALDPCCSSAMRTATLTDALPTEPILAGSSKRARSDCRNTLQLPGRQTPGALQVID